MSGAEASTAEGGQDDPWASAWGDVWTANHGDEGRVQAETAAENGGEHVDRPPVSNDDSPEQGGGNAASQSRHREPGVWVDWTSQSWSDSNWRGSWGQSWGDGWQQDSWQQNGADWNGRQRWQRAASDPVDQVRTPEGSVSDGDGSGGRDSVAIPGLPERRRLQDGPRLRLLHDPDLPVQVPTTSQDDEQPRARRWPFPPSMRNPAEMSLGPAPGPTCVKSTLGPK